MHSATDPRRSSGPSVKAGPTAATHRPGTSSYTARRHANWALFGFPPPGHPYWTPKTLTGMQQRYPGLDLTPWRHGQT
jgi:hypothetical protein